MSYMGNGSGSRRSVRRQQDNIYGRRATPNSGSNRRHTVDQGFRKNMLIEKIMGEPFTIIKAFLSLANCNVK